MAVELSFRTWRAMPILRGQLECGSTPQATEISSAHIRVVQEGMYSVVNSAGGTAKGAAIRIPGFAMAGKTGTSQVRRISRTERKTGVVKNEHLPWEKRDHALFIGYAPYEQPRYAIAVIIEHGGAGSRAAAPVTRDILIAARKAEQSRIAGRTGDQLSQLGPSG